MHVRRILVARTGLFAYAAGGIGLPAPCTPGRGIAPGPQIDVVVWELSGAIGNGGYAA